MLKCRVWPTDACDEGSTPPASLKAHVISHPKAISVQDVTVVVKIFFGQPLKKIDLELHV